MTVEVGEPVVDGATATVPLIENRDFDGDIESSKTELRLIIQEGEWRINEIVGEWRSRVARR